MKMQIFVIFAKENKHLKDKKYCKVGNHRHYTGEYRAVVHSIFNLKYHVPNIDPIVIIILSSKS